MFIFCVYSILHLCVHVWVCVCECVCVSVCAICVCWCLRMHVFICLCLWVCMHMRCVFVTADMCVRVCVHVCVRTRVCACLWFTMYSVPACARFDDWHVTFVKLGCLYVLLIHEIMNACILLETWLVWRSHLNYKHQNGKFFSVHAMKAYRSTGDRLLLILNLGVRWRWVIILMSWLLYSWGNSCWWPLHGRLGKSHSHYGCLEEDKCIQSLGVETWIEETTWQTET